MSGEDHAPKPGPQSDSVPTVAPSEAGTAATGSETKSPNLLTPEEQMALFEKELKETDWGHQPC